MANIHCYYTLDNVTETRTHEDSGIHVCEWVCKNCMVSTSNNLLEENIL